MKTRLIPEPGEIHVVTRATIDECWISGRYIPPDEPAVVVHDPEHTASKFAVGRHGIDPLVDAVEAAAFREVEYVGLAERVGCFPPDHRASVRGHCAVCGEPFAVGGWIGTLGRAYVHQYCTAEFIDAVEEFWTHDLAARV